jgi:eukaryotic-like serine/threonine-protein kinase
VPEPSPETVEALFHQAADLEPERRAAFLDERCAGDPDLRAAVEELLHFDAKARSATDFLQSPVADARLTLAAMAAPVLASVGRYRVVRRLGEGGMGTVYEAEQDDPRRTVALKVMRLGLDSPNLRKRFSQEARILGRLHHVGIARIYDAGATEDGQLYFAMEFIRGLRLDEHVRRHVPDARARLDLAARVCDAVQHAHEQGVVHRDLKPANVLVDEAGQPNVLDFGVAQATGAGHLGSSAHTRTGQLVGTLGYMSPEQVAGDPRAIDARSDVYTVGVILFELLADRLPYRLDDLPIPEVMRVIREEEPSRLGSVNRQFRGAVETIVAKALEKDRARRYQSAGELAEELRRHLAHEPIRARPVGRIQRAARWVRRYPLEAVSLAGVVAIFLTAFALVSWSYWRAEDARKDEAKQRQAADAARDDAQRKEKAERWGRYRSNIAAASGALQLQNSGAARSALDDAPQAHRNWEWQYLHSQLDGASLVLPVPGGKIESLVLGPSGRQIAVCCFEHNEVYLYDVATGRLEAVLRGHSAPATSVAYRPDGKQVATASNDQTIRLWDPATGQQTALLKAEVAPPNLERMLLVAYNSDGSRIASYPSLEGGAGTSRLWDATTGQEIAVLGKWQEFASPVAFSPDGKRVAVGSSECVYLCDAVTGRRLAVLGPHAKTVGRLAYSPDGKRIASATGAGSNAVHLWDGESGKEVAVLPGHTARVDSVLFSPDGSRLVSGSNYPDNTARLWDAATGRLLAVLDGHKNAIWSVAFSPDGKRLATASSDQTARLWDGRTGQFLAPPPARAYGPGADCPLQPERYARRHRLARCNPSPLGRSDGRIDRCAPRTRR